MALQKQLISVPFTGGLNQKVNDHLLPLSQFSALENCFYAKTGGLRIRNGVSQIGANTSPANAMSTVAAIGSELVHMDGQTLWSWSPSDGASGAWQERGRIASCDVRVESVFGGLEIDLASDGLAVVNAAINGDFICYIAKSTGANDGDTCRVIVKDTVSGAVIFNDLLADVEVTGDITVCARGADEFRIVYQSAAAPANIAVVDVENIGTGTPGFDTPFNTVTDLSSNSPRFDYITDTDQTTDCLAYINTSEDLIIVSTGGGSPATITGTVTNVSVGEMGIADDWVIFYRDSVAQELRVTARNKSDNTQTLAPATVVASPDPGDAQFYLRLSVLEHPVIGDTWLVWSQPDAATASGEQVVSLTQRKRITYALGSYSTAISEEDVATNAFLAGRPFTDDTFAMTYAPVVNVTHNTSSGSGGHTGTLMFFAFSEVAVDPYVVARCFVRRVPDRISSPLPRVITTGTDTRLFPFLRVDAAGLMQHTSGLLGRALCSLVGVTLDLSQQQMSVCESNGLLLVAGGVLYYYDGVETAECGVLINPGVTVGGPAWGIITGGVGGNLSDGVYSFALAFMGRDAKGNEHYSGVAQALATVTANTGAGNDRISITTVGPCLTQREKVDIVYYRTVADGSIHYVDEISHDVKADGWSNFIIGENADTSINSNAVMYTDGGELDHVCPPTPYCIATDGSVIALIPCEDRTSIWASLPVRQNLGPAFSDQLVYRVAAGGDLTAATFMDGRLIWFRENQIGYMLGTPPAADGSGGYTEPRTVATDVGAEDFRSIVQIPAGTLFKSAKGFYLLGRNLAVEYVGASVEDYNAETVQSSMLHAELNQAWFAMSGGDVLVYDYEKNVWSSFTGFPGTTIKSLATYQGTPILGNDVGSVYEMPSDVWQDNGETQVVAVATTGHANLAGLAGFQRLYRVALLGKTHGKAAAPSTAVDTSVTLVMQQNRDRATVATLLNAQSSDDIQATADRHVAVRVKIPDQKCSAVAFVLTWADANEIDQAITWTGIDLEIGQKRGMRKLPPAGSF